MSEIVTDMDLHFERNLSHQNQARAKLARLSTYTTIVHLEMSYIPHQGLKYTCLDDHYSNTLCANTVWVCRDRSSIRCLVAFVISLRSTLRLTRSSRLATWHINVDMSRALLPFPYIKLTVSLVSLGEDWLYVGSARFDVVIHTKISPLLVVNVSLAEHHALLTPLSQASSLLPWASSPPNSG